MKFEVALEQLQFYLSSLNSIVHQKSVIPIMSNIFLEVDDDDGSLKLATANGESTLIVHLSAKVSEGGKVTIPAQKFKDVLASMSPLTSGNAVEFDLDEANYTLSYKSGKVKGTLKGMRADNFPSTEAPEHTDILVNVAALYDAVAHTIIASDKPKSSRPELQGIFFLPDGPRLKLVAGDGTRLAVENIECVPQARSIPGEGAIIPARVFKTIRSILKEKGADETVAITFPTDDYGKIVFTVDNVTFITQVINETYPDVYLRAPTDFAIEARLLTDMLMAASKQMTPYVVDSGYSVTMNIPPGKKAGDTKNGSTRECLFAGESEDGDGAGTSFPGMVIGDDIELNFNVDYLMHALRVLGVSAVSIWMNAADKAIVLTPCYEEVMGVEAQGGRYDFQYTFMPLSRGRVITKRYQPDPDHADPTTPYYLQG